MIIYINKHLKSAISVVLLSLFTFSTLGVELCSAAVVTTNTAETAITDTPGTNVVQIQNQSNTSQNVVNNLNTVADVIVNNVSNVQPASVIIQAPQGPTWNASVPCKDSSSPCVGTGSFDNSINYSFDLKASDPKGISRYYLDSATRDGVVYKGNLNGESDVKFMTINATTGHVDWLTANTVQGGQWAFKWGAINGLGVKSFVTTYVNVAHPPIVNPTVLGSSVARTNPGLAAQGHFLAEQAINPAGFENVWLDGIEHGAVPTRWLSSFNIYGSQGLTNANIFRGNTRPPGMVTLFKESTAGAYDNAMMKAVLFGQRQYDQFTDNSSPVAYYYPGHMDDGRISQTEYAFGSFIDKSTVGSSSSEVPRVKEDLLILASIQKPVFNYLRDHGLIMAFVYYAAHMASVGNNAALYESFKGQPNFIYGADFSSDANTLLAMKTVNQVTLANLSQKWPGMTTLSVTKTTGSGSTLFTYPTSVAMIDDDPSSTVQKFHVNASTLVSDTRANITGYDWTLLQGDPNNVTIVVSPDKKSADITIRATGEKYLTGGTYGNTGVATYTYLYDIGITARGANGALGSMAHFTDYSNPLTKKVRTYDANGKLVSMTATYLLGGDKSMNGVTSLLNMSSIHLDGAKTWNQDVFDSFDSITGRAIGFTRSYMRKAYSPNGKNLTDYYKISYASNGTKTEWLVLTWANVSLKIPASVRKVTSYKLNSSKRLVAVLSTAMAWPF